MLAPQTSHLLRLFSLFFVFFVTTAGSTEEGDNRYLLGPGDQLTIRVFGEQELSPTLRIDDQGRINYPFLGQLNVQGKTASEIEREISGGLKGPYLVDPKVSVAIAQYRPFFINGEVRTPGSYEFQPGLTVRKAISLAGGFGERAAKNKVFVIRDRGESAEPVRVALDDLLGPGDILSVRQSFF